MYELKENVESALNFLQELYLTVSKPSVASVNVTKSKYIETAILTMKKYIESEIDCQNYLGELAKVSAELEQVKRERDAAIKDLGSSSNNCFYCKYRSKTDKECTAVPSITGRCFEWRGVRED